MLDLRTFPACDIANQAIHFFSKRAKQKLQEGWMPDGDQGKVTTAQKQQQREVAQDLDRCNLIQFARNRHGSVDHSTNPSAEIFRVAFVSNGHCGAFSARILLSLRRHRPVRWPGDRPGIVAIEIANPGANRALKFPMRLIGKWNELSGGS